MKTRSGFVSNSSSSSFIVRRTDIYGKQLTTDEQDRILEDYGFKKLASYYSDQVPDMSDKRGWKDQAKYLKDCENFSYGYTVSCNQDDVMVFLIKNKIQFAASVHYDHYTYIYTPEMDELAIATNLGKLMEMHGVLKSAKCDCLKIISGEEYVEKNSDML